MLVVICFAPLFCLLYYLTTHYLISQPLTFIISYIYITFKLLLVLSALQFVILFILCFYFVCYNAHMDKLTLKQEMFCKEYIIDFNGKQAAIRAGYSESSASESACENLTKSNVQEFLKTIMKKRADKLEINQEYVLKNIIEVQQRCMQHKPVMYFDKEKKEYVQETAIVEHEDGTKTSEGVYTFDANNANKSLDMLAKYTGFYSADNDQKCIIIPVIKDDI